MPYCEGIGFVPAEYAWLNQIIQIKQIPLASPAPKYSTNTRIYCEDLFGLHLFRLTFVLLYNRTLEMWTVGALCLARSIR